MLIVGLNAGPARGLIYSGPHVFRELERGFLRMLGVSGGALALEFFDTLSLIPTPACKKMGLYGSAMAALLACNTVRSRVLVKARAVEVPKLPVQVLRLIWRFV